MLTFPILPICPFTFGAPVRLLFLLISTAVAQTLEFEVVPCDEVSSTQDLASSQYYHGYTVLQLSKELKKLALTMAIETGAYRGRLRWREKRRHKPVIEAKHLVYLAVQAYSDHLYAEAVESLDQAAAYDLDERPVDPKMQTELQLRCIENIENLMDTTATVEEFVREHSLRFEAADSLVITRKRDKKCAQPE